MAWPKGDDGDALLMTVTFVPTVKKTLGMICLKQKLCQLMPVSLE